MNKDSDIMMEETIYLLEQLRDKNITRQEYETRRKNMFKEYKASKGE